MLRPGARRKDVLRQLHRSSENLIFPWLCPALLRYQGPPIQRRPVARCHTPTGNYHARRCISQSSRHRATADSPTPISLGDPYIPFESLPFVQGSAPGSTVRPWSGVPQETQFPGFDPSSLVILDQHVETTEKKLLQRMSGVAGGVEDVRALYQACLRLHRYKRAEILLLRFGKIFADNKPALLEVHNQYLHSMVSYIMTQRKTSMLASLQRWFEVEMRSKHYSLEPDASSYALMIKASLHSLHGFKRDRTVRRYIALIIEEGIENETLGLPILTDAELGQISEICPTEFLSPDFSFPEFEPVTDPSEVTNFRDQAVSDAVPEVRSAPQKGLGLMTLKDSLSLFSKNSQLPVSQDPDATSKMRDESYATMRQERLERDAIASALGRWRKENDDLKAIGIDPSLRGKSIGSLLWTWCEALAPKIQAELRETEISELKPDRERTQKDKLRCEYGPYLGVIPAERLAAITIIGVLKRMTRRRDVMHITVARLSVIVGTMVAREHEAEMSLKFRDADAMNPRNHNSRGLTHRQEILAKMLRRKKYKRGEKYASKDYITLQKEPGKSLGGGLEDGTTLAWPETTRAQIGATLVSLLAESATMLVPEESVGSDKSDYSLRRVFTHEVIYDRGRNVGVINPLPAFLEKLAKEPPSNAISNHLPMVCPPKSWNGTRGGGFLTEGSDVLRWKEPSQLRYAQAAADKGDLDEFFAGLNVLGRTPWKINAAVLKVMVEAWNTGKEIANFKSETPDIKYPEKPEDMDDAKVRNKYFRAIVQADNLVGGYHSERCFHNLQLELAKGYQDETFYFPHNVDFRGRAYPQSAYLNQMGADHCRGLLLFGEGKPLGSSGLRWLKIHLANVFGYDKVSLQEREDFATTHLADIYDTASNPLNGAKWWLKAEDPWQTLATSIELKSALDSPDASAYVSYLPVHQDGSCNGLQHYAALGGDLIGAKQVNLEPGERPADVYSGVADMVKKEIDADAADGLQIAKYLQGKLTRKVVKQPVMTNVYGVTFIGAKRQVEKQLADLFPNADRIGNGFSYDRAAFYITRKIFKSMATMFSGAHEIQDWLGLCGSRISLAVSQNQVDQIEDEMDQALGLKRKATTDPRKRGRTPRLKEVPDFITSITWTTPLKLPVVQPYRKNTAKTIKTILQNLSLQSPNSKQCVDKRRQLQAFPPNFIHSLDATHMMLSALKCNEKGLTFAAVHDSFWTHPCDIDTMSSILRDAFIRMHSDDIVGRLAAEFNARYKNYMYLCQMDSNSGASKAIKAYRRTMWGEGKRHKHGRKFVELVNERKRVRLLASMDPENVEEGKAMVTAASVLADYMAKADAESISEAQIEAVESNRMDSAVMGDPASLDAEPKELKDFLKEADYEEEEVDDDLVEAEDDATTEAEDDAASEAAKSAEAAANEEYMKYNGAEHGRRKPITTSIKRKSATWVWLPLTFPDVPRKGAFDVKRLKESTYFFS